MRKMLVYQKQNKTAKTVNCSYTYYCKLFTPVQEYYSYLKLKKTQKQTNLKPNLF